ncbi:MAG: phosphoribosylanthranilate isomerase [Xenococcaceae cyanobacterium MO_167.B27]|nr:phosphoribosylanthranilate isomerase [Xenococcaceae cyanobacterium MO_167.B27]
MRIKICGITQPQQGVKIASLGATALGFICVSKSPRYVTPEKIREIRDILPVGIDAIAVFADANLEDIVKIVNYSGLTGVQLHGAESPTFCHQLRSLLPDNIELIKAFRIRTAESLTELAPYTDACDTFLLDAYHPQMLGGTGKTLNWQDLQQFKPAKPWILAGGLTPDNILDALSKLQPDGIDLSSGVERSPGDKDLDKVALLFSQLIKRKDEG